MEDKETGRLEAFSDGVFGVAITLLVLNIKTLPVDSAGKLLTTTDAFWSWFFGPSQGPTLFAFVTSFATIGIMWLNHHRIFNHIKRVNTGLILLNLLLLLIIVFIPVPTALLAAYLGDPTQHQGAILYSGTFFVMACCFNILWRYASYHNRLLGKNVDSHAVTAISRQYLFGPLFYLISLGLAFVNVPACIIFNFALALFFAVPGRLPRQYGDDGDDKEAP